MWFLGFVSPATSNILPHGTSPRNLGLYSLLLILESIEANVEINLLIPFQELYIFNKFGQHVLTKDIMTSSVVYRMSYTQATSNGRLDSVTDAAGRKLTIVRDLRGQVSAQMDAIQYICTG